MDEQLREAALEYQSDRDQIVRSSASDGKPTENRMPE